MMISMTFLPDHVVRLVNGGVVVTSERTNELRTLIALWASKIDMEC